MSGREHEPVAAFFPSIDRNLMRDLDRHLRAAPQTIAAPQTVAAPPPDKADAAVAAQHLQHDSVTQVIVAIEQAGQTVAAMSNRIGELEAHVYEVDAANQHLEAQVADLSAKLEEAANRLQAENQRAQRAEHLIAQHAARSRNLERDLTQAQTDLAKVSESILTALGRKAQTAG